MVGGGPGVGKTRLAAELSAEAAEKGMRVLVGHCYDRDESLPYLPFLEMIEMALSQVANPQEFREAIGHQVFGCDICQDVCPWNRKAPATGRPEFQPREGLVNPALAWLAEISEEEFRERFRGSPIKRTKRSGLRRNTLIAIGNSGDRSLLPIAERACGDADPVISESAHWAKARLDQPET